MIIRARLLLSKRIFKFVILDNSILKDNIFIINKLNQMQLAANMGLPYTNQVGGMHVM